MSNCVMRYWPWSLVGQMLCLSYAVSILCWHVLVLACAFMFLKLMFLFVVYRYDILPNWHYCQLHTAHYTFEIFAG